MNGILTVKQAASQLMVCEETIARWLRNGKLKGYKIGRLWRIKESDLERLVAGAGVTHGEPSKRKSRPAQVVAPALAQDKKGG